MKHPNRFGTNEDKVSIIVGEYESSFYYANVDSDLRWYNFMALDKNNNDSCDLLWVNEDGRLVGDPI